AVRSKVDRDTIEVYDLRPWKKPAWVVWPSIALAAGCSALATWRTRRISRRAGARDKSCGQGSASLRPRIQRLNLQVVKIDRPEPCQRRRDLHEATCRHAAVEDEALPGDLLLLQRGLRDADAERFAAGAVEQHRPVRGGGDRRRHLDPAADPHQAAGR